MVHTCGDYPFFGGVRFRPCIFGRSISVKPVGKGNIYSKRKRVDTGLARQGLAKSAIFQPVVAGFS